MRPITVEKRIRIYKSFARILCVLTALSVLIGVLTAVIMFVPPEHGTIDTELPYVAALSLLFDVVLLVFVKLKIRKYEKAEAEWRSFKV